jgi:hypothetical protein
VENKLGADCPKIKTDVESEELEPAALGDWAPQINSRMSCIGGKTNAQATAAAAKPGGAEVAAAGTGSSVVHERRRGPASNTGGEDDVGCSSDGNLHRRSGRAIFIDSGADSVHSADSIHSADSDHSTTTIRSAGRTVEHVSPQLSPRADPVDPPTGIAEADSTSSGFGHWLADRAQWRETSLRRGLPKQVLPAEAPEWQQRLRARAV